MTFVDQAFRRREAFIWAASKPSDSTAGDTPQSAIYYDVQSAIYLPLLSGEEVLGVMYVDNYFIRDAFSLTDFELLRAIANQVAMFLKDHVLRKDLQRGELLRSNLLRQYSPKVADRILKKMYPPAARRGRGRSGYYSCIRCPWLHGAQCKNGTQRGSICNK